MAPRKQHILVNDNGERLASGLLTQVGPPFRVGGIHSHVVAACECGQHIVVRKTNLQSGNSTNCGGRNHRSLVHGHAKTPEHKAWHAMLQRCYRESNSNFKWYGGRGIEVCDRWRFGEHGKHGLQCFIEDMGHRPVGDAFEWSLDRINPDGNYEPDNCRWADCKMQIWNQRRQRFIQWEGYRFPSSEFSRLKGHQRRFVQNRIRLGWSIKDAIEVPKHVEPSGCTTGQRQHERAKILRSIMRTHCGVG